LSACDLLIKNSLRAVRLDKPVSLMLMPTDHCATDCVYCYACRRPVEPDRLLPIPRILDLITEAAELGVLVINLDGGDLLVRDGHLEILAHMRDLGIVPGISTKAHVTRAHADALYDAGVRWVQVGLDAVDPLADRLVRRRDYVRRAVESITNLAAAGVKVRTNSIVVPESLEQLPQLVDLLMGLPLVNVKFAPAFRSAYRGSDNLVLNPEQKERFREHMRDAIVRYPERAPDINWECKDDVLDMSNEASAKRFAARPMCSSGRSQMVITPDGKVVTCEMSPQDGAFVVGDCAHQSIQEVWDSKAMQRWWRMPQERFQGTPCFDCREFDACIVTVGQCWFRSLCAYGTPFAPHPDCPKAPPPTRRWD
jgi:radical SAM protein with 4Fe4S-binding SPASM domain